ncbi:MAG: flagellar basal-body rod protein FlgB [Microbacteriaceae bacterium]|nr:flagellar basal-body rod protein FlgB [Microbacteriaceae bacterium]
MLDSVTLNAMTSALNGFSATQTAISNNIANINTPNYTAQEVDFSAALAQSVAEGNGTLSDAAFTPSASLDPTQLNGNNVSLSEETLKETTNGLKFQLASQAASQQFSEVRAAAVVN